MHTAFRLLVESQKNSTVTYKPPCSLKYGKNSANSIFDLCQRSIQSIEALYHLQQDSSIGARAP